ncbi:hypothetical protein DFJ73DRAFT_961527 [Zopfochytrium polystomum]|nr:hypothetical protein DFJ73DRAFT_961527 [Zopfochytrium polystomum]
MERQMKWRAQETSMTIQFLWRADDAFEGREPDFVEVERINAVYSEMETSLNQGTAGYGPQADIRKDRQTQITSPPLSLKHRHSENTLQASASGFETSSDGKASAPNDLSIADDKQRQPDVPVLSNTEFVPLFVASPSQCSSPRSTKSTIVAVALGAIAQEFNALGQTTSIVTAYFLTAMDSSRTSLDASLCDHYAHFASRAIAGLGGGGIFSFVVIIIADIVPVKERGKYNGLVGACFGFAVWVPVTRGRIRLLVVGGVLTIVFLYVEANWAANPVIPLSMFKDIKPNVVLWRMRVLQSGVLPGVVPALDRNLLPLIAGACVGCTIQTVIFVAQFTARPDPLAIVTANVNLFQTIGAVLGLAIWSVTFNSKQQENVYANLAACESDPDVHCADGYPARGARARDPWVCADPAADVLRRGRVWRPPYRKAQLCPLRHGRAPGLRSVKEKLIRRSFDALLRRTVAMLWAANAANVLENALMNLSHAQREQAFMKVDEMLQ